MCWGLNLTTLSFAITQTIISRFNNTTSCACNRLHWCATALDSSDSHNSRRLIKNACFMPLICMGTPTQWHGTHTHTDISSMPPGYGSARCTSPYLQSNCFSASHNRLIADTILCKFPPTFGHARYICHEHKQMLFTSLQDLLQPGSP